MGASADDFAMATTPADLLLASLRHAGRLSAPTRDLLTAYYAKWLDGLKSDRLRFWYNEQLREADNLISSGTRVLEIGVGSGSEFLWWASRGASMVGIDAFEHCVSATNERVGFFQEQTGRKLDATAKTVSIIDFEDDAGFDIIWMEQTFHHLEPREQVVRKIAALLRPGGRVVLSEANALNPLIQLQLLRYRGLKTVVEVSSPAGPVLWGNERILSRPSLAKWLGSVGISEEAARYFRVFPSHPTFDRFFALERRLSSQWCAPIFSHYNFVGRKLA